MKKGFPVIWLTICSVHHEEHRIGRVALAVLFKNRGCVRGILEELQNTKNTKILPPQVCVQAQWGTR